MSFNRILRAVYEKDWDSLHSLRTEEIDGLNTPDVPDIEAMRDAWLEETREKTQCRGSVEFLPKSPWIPPPSATSESDPECVLDENEPMHEREASGIFAISSNDEADMDDLRIVEDTRDTAVYCEPLPERGTDIHCYQIPRSVPDIRLLSAWRYNDSVKGKPDSNSSSAIVDIIAALGTKSAMFPAHMELVSTRDKCMLFGDVAAFNGDREMMAWLRDKRFRCDSVTFSYAIANGWQLETLKKLKDSMKSDGWINPHSTGTALGRGDTDILDWMFDGCGDDLRFYAWNLEFAATNAVKSENAINVLKWMRNHGCVLDGMAVTHAAETLNFSVLRWLHEEARVPLSRTVPNVVIGAAVSAATDAPVVEQIVEWLLDCSVSFHDETMLESVKSGNVRLVDLLHLRQIPWSFDVWDACMTLDEEKRVSILRYLWEHKAPMQMMYRYEEAKAWSIAYVQSCIDIDWQKLHSALEREPPLVHDEDSFRIEILARRSTNPVQTCDVCVQYHGIKGD